MASGLNSSLFLEGKEAVHREQILCFGENSGGTKFYGDGAELVIKFVYFLSMGSKILRLR